MQAGETLVAVPILAEPMDVEFAPRLLGVVAVAVAARPWHAAFAPLQLAAGLSPLLAAAMEPPCRQIGKYYN